MIARISITLCVLVFLFLVSTTYVHALIINEVYPAPSGDLDEWVELYNDTDDHIDLSQYVLTDEIGKNTSFDTQTLGPKEYGLATSKNVLNNSGDTLILKKVTDEIIEIATYSGSIDSSKSIARCPDGTGSFMTTQTITKRGSNSSSCQSTLQLQPSTSSTPTSLISVDASQTFSSLYISESMVHPEDQDFEWVEIYNANSFEVRLTNWFIDDGESTGSTPKPFSITVASQGYGVINLTSDIFNNTGDSVRLLDSTQKQIDSISYTTATQGKSIGKSEITSNSVCIQDATKGNKNSSCIAAQQKNNSIQKPTPTSSDTKTTFITLQNDEDEEIKPSSNTIIQTNIKPQSIKPKEDISQTQGDILGINNIHTGNYLYVMSKSFAVASYLISLFTISYLVHKIVKRSTRQTL